MEELKVMKDGTFDFKKLIREIKGGVKSKDLNGNQYLVTNNMGGHKKLKLKFDPNLLSEKQKTDLAKNLAKDVMKNPRSSILALAELPEGYGFDRSILKTTLTETLGKKSTKSSSVADKANKFNRLSSSLWIIGLIFWGLGTVAAPLTGIILMCVGVVASFPPLLIPIIGACVVMSFLVMGVIGYAKFKERREGKKLNVLKKEVATLQGFSDERSPDELEEIKNNPMYTIPKYFNIRKESYDVQNTLRNNYLNSKGVDQVTETTATYEPKKFETTSGFGNSF